MDFCEICNLFSKTTANMNRNSVYVCKGHFTKSGNVICEHCGLFVNSTSSTYRCRCKSPKVRNKLNKSSKS